jgi:hypothetical protein
VAYTIRRFLFGLVIVLALMLAGCAGSGGDDLPADPPSPGPGPGGSGDDTEPTYLIGGTVSGMTGSGLVLSNNASDEVTIDAPGGFAFGIELLDGDRYDVRVATQPGNPDNVCTVDHGSGTVDGADVATIEVFCTGSLALIDTAPANDDQAVSREIEPILTFSADIDSATAVPENITLASAASEVAVRFDVTGSVVTLTPDDILLPLTGYTLTVTTDVAGSAGERLLDPETLTFRTRDASWQDDVEIDANPNDVVEAQIAFDGDGNALAVWSQATLDTTDLWWNYYTPGVGWGTAAPLEENDDDVYAGAVRLGFDDAGNALAVWILTDGVSDSTSVRSSRFAAPTGWEIPEFIETGPGTVVGTAELALNSDGEAVAVWTQFDGTFINVWLNRYTAGGGWGRAEIIDESDEVAENPQVAMDGGGNVLAVWQMPETGSPATDVWARRFTPAGGWSPSTLLSTGNDFNAGSAQAAMDEDGNALVVWLQGLGLETGVYARRFSAGAWENPLQLSVSDGMEHPRLALDFEGNALAVWEQRVDVNGMPEMVAHAARFTANAGWDAPVTIGNRTAFYPKVAFDPGGNALAVWFELDVALPIGTGWSVWSNRYTNGSGWTAAEQIGSSGDLIGTDMPNLAIDPNGNAFAIWTRATEVRVNRFE